jgi:hypothetical protein
MSIHKVTNIFVGNGSALEADVNTLTPGKLGLFGQNQAILASAYSAGGASESITVSKTFADGTFKKSMSINGRSVQSARAERYKPAAREVWAVGHNRLGSVNAGTIEVNNATEYSLNIRFKNDKSLYSERPEVLRVSFTSSATATQLSIATQIAAAINNSGFKSLITAVVIGDGTGVLGLTAATDYGVEIYANDINQFASSTYKENRVYFSCHVDDSTGFGTTTTCAQIQANNPGEGTYNFVYNKENFEYQYEGLSNRRLWPAQTVEFGVSSTGYLSANVAAAATSATGNVSAVAVGDDTLTFATSTAGLRGGEIIDVNGVQYEILYVISSTVVRIKGLATAVYLGGAAVKVKYFYNLIVITFADNTFTSGADVQALATKAIYIATPAIDAGATDPFDTTGDANDTSTEGLSLLSKLNTWLASTPAAPATLTFA